ncbi:MAG: zinc-ribbon domain-containing protein [Deltaproteobacteria bacterium]|nr:zinc-ribbon domain-containing protein [Deltaproteobacteria bacterium]
MIIQCEQCQTRFRLDDSKVTDRGVKVRCAKCKHVFSVGKGGPEAAQPDFGALLDQSAAFTPEESPASPASQQEPPASAAASESGFDYSDFVSSDFADHGASPEFGGYEPPKDEAAPAPAPGDDFSLSALEGEQGFALEHDETQTKADDVDFGEFDFGGEVGFGEKESAPLSEPGAEQFGFDSAAGGSAAIQGDMDSAATEQTPPAAAEPREEVSINLGEFEFGGELAVKPVEQEAPLEPEPRREVFVEPPEQPVPEPEAGEDTLRREADVETPQEEPPPLSIPSRRRQNPLVSVLIAVVAVVVLAVLGFFGYTMFLEEKGKGVAEAGRITLRAVNASFVNNQAAGDLLVISGEAVNAYGKPRAAIQVKGMVYGADGRVLATKSAYCGNPLTNEQLAGMPLEKIEAAMANQFGDSLANLEVPPGKAIPFVIVIAKPPVDAREYGVEPAGSTVATGKQ